MRSPITSGVSFNTRNSEAMISMVSFFHQVPLKQITRRFSLLPPDEAIGAQAGKTHFNDVKKLKQGDKGHYRVLSPLRLMILISLLLPAFALPKAWAVEVPNVVGSPQATAESDITNLGLTVGVVTPAISGGVPIGNVISQDPEAGINVVSGTPVSLVVSGVAVPDVVGLAQAAAESAITGAGLTVGAITTANHPSVPAGNVISQNPAAGTNVFQGNAVAFVVSVGIAVPNVVGLTQAAAQSAITSAGLTVGTVTMANSPTVAIGNVISQTPSAGTNVA
ncbi:MAG: PASTA domain-containing protein, partial [Nitrospirota bacterium]|nr:PASTA domain-containing protein [Nitrospirota bacterium]